MKFTQDKKQAILTYMLEKIEQGSEQLSKSVADTFNVNQNTIHTYVNQLVAENKIRRIQRGQYELVSTDTIYQLSRESGHLDSDLFAYEAYLQPHLKTFEKNVQDIWAYALTEMTNNVMDHSRAERLTVIIRQNCLKTAIILQDDGVGIFEKIKHHFGLSTLDEAIQELFKGKLTTDSENHSGEGIFFTSKLMDEFVILSSGKIFAVNKFDSSRLAESGSPDGKGTTVLLALSNHTKKTVTEIFDAYSDPDCRFTKTLIPLKHMFETAPVSRSQARRVCNRLDQFQEIEIDFKDIEWIGQGFAHELFVVFAKKHPDITLLPVNMKETVEKMVKHVTD
ncbi:MAG: DUF4325 domain-containing protein [Clostridia bacterium]|nr:DUF4325 domain-containing protein [Clostridia bacterium]